MEVITSQRHTIEVENFQQKVMAQKGQGNESSIEKEKVKGSDQVYSTWVGRPHFSRCIYQRLLDSHSTPVVDPVSKTKSMPIHVVGDPAVDETKKKMSRSSESSPIRSNLTGKDRSIASLSPWANGNIAADGSGPDKSKMKNKNFDGIKVSGKCRDSDEDLSLEGENIKRTPSWSQYFETPNGAHSVEAGEEWMVDMSQLFLGKKFASGSHSRLYQGVYKNQEVAVKVMKQHDEDEEMSMKLDRQFMQEVSLMSALHHANVVQFVAACRKPPVCCIITEYLPGGSLRAFLHKREPHSIPLETIVPMALDVARGMRYLHSQGVVHRDLKSENLVLTEDLRIKVTDFGVGCLESDCISPNGDLGTYRWMAPEFISHKHYSKKVDVYSFGIVLWELVTGLLPFEEMTAVQAAFAVVNKNARPMLPDHCPVPLGKLMQLCWSTNPKKRPDFWQIVMTLEHLETSLRQNVSFST